MIASTLVMGSLGSAVAAAAADPGSLPFPHPLITEVLYAVPSGDRGDANGDGTRDAVGDEFIELVNLHDRPIQLKGYTLMDSDAHSLWSAEAGTRNAGQAGRRVPLREAGRRGASQLPGVRPAQTRRRPHIHRGGAFRVSRA